MADGTHAQETGSGIEADVRSCAAIGSPRLLPRSSAVMGFPSSLADLAREAAVLLTATIYFCSNRSDIVGEASEQLWSKGGRV